MTTTMHSAQRAAEDLRGWGLVGREEEGRAVAGATASGLAEEP